MADIQSRDPLGASAGQAGSAKRQQSSGSGGGMADQAKETVRDFADKASDTWDDMSKQGQRYYRQGSRAVSNLDQTSMTGLLIAGTIGFGLGWLIFGQGSFSDDSVARRMSRSSERDY